MGDRFWWEQTSVYWELPFFAEMGICCPELGLDRGDELAAREQLWFIREESIRGGRRCGVTDCPRQALEGLCSEHQKKLWPHDFQKEK